MADLFAADPEAATDGTESRPLADQLRPRSLDEVIGQRHLLGPDGALRRMIASGRLGSLSSSNLENRQFERGAAAESRSVIKGSGGAAKFPSAHNVHPGS